MERLYRSLLCKILAVFFGSVFLLTLLFSCAGILFLLEDGAYLPQHYSYYDSMLCEDTLRRKAQEIRQYWLYELDPAPESPDSDVLSRYEDRFTTPNFFYTLRAPDGAVLFSSAEGKNYAFARELRIADSYRFVNGTHMETERYVLEYFIADPLDLTAADQLAEEALLVGFLYQTRYLLIGLTAASLLFDLLLLIFLCKAAGRRGSVEGFSLTRADRIPYDLTLVICFLLLLGLTFLTALLLSHPLPDSVSLTRPGLYGFLPLLLQLIALVLLHLLLTTVTRCKCGTLLRNTLLWRIAGWCLRKAASVIRYIPAVWQGLLGFLAALTAEFFLILLWSHAYGGEELFFGGLFLALNIVLALALCRALLQMKTLREGARRLAEGQLHAQLDTALLSWIFREHGQDLNSIAVGMGKAVEERMKSERMRTDLITNVSHDIKTPLTSIMNYVDLLKKEPSPSEKVREYLEVLDRQSARLKKLTEDLVEASKAATGHLPVAVAPLDLAELTEQSVGEYARRLEAAGLTPVLGISCRPVSVPADGRLLWRMLDNLMSNVCKYALEGTRVYLDLQTEGNTARLTVKNVSRIPLNISPEELTERFVRGDASRSTEGSGLGLSIVQSLARLQNIGFRLEIDGDLFKAILEFPPFSGSCEPQQPSSPPPAEPAASQSSD